MPASIASMKAKKARSGIGRRQIAHAYRDAADLQQPYSFPSGGTYTFTAPSAGRWKFVGWGPGGNSTAGNPAASGAYVEITRFLPVGGAVTIVTGVANSSNTTITFADGAVATAGRAAGVTPGTASGGDVNLNGSAAGVAGLGTGGGAAGEGGGAPANLPYRGAMGATSTALALTPGGGAGDPGAGGVGGGGSFAIATLLGD